MQMVDLLDQRVMTFEQGNWVEISKNEKIHYVCNLIEILFFL